MSLIARGPQECHLYMDLHPCSCGEWDFPWSHHESQQRPEGRFSVYVGTCPRCGSIRRFEFAVSDQPVPPPAFGGPEPSQIIGADEFYALSQRAAAAAAAPPPGELADAYVAAADAVAALEEVLKFIPPGAAAVPPEALRTEAGRAGYAADPGPYDRGRLEALLYAYRETLLARSRAMDHPAHGTGHAGDAGP